MTIVRSGVVGYEDAEKTVLYDVDDVYGIVDTRTVWKPDSPGDYQSQMQSKLQQAVTYFGGNYSNWDALTAAQKDAANKQAQRALANIARWLLGDFSSAGS